MYAASLSYSRQLIPNADVKSLFVWAKFGSPPPPDSHDPTVYQFSGNHSHHAYRYAHRSYDVRAANDRPRHTPAR